MPKTGLFDCSLSFHYSYYYKLFTRNGFWISSKTKSKEKAFLQGKQRKKRVVGIKGFCSYAKGRELLNGYILNTISYDYVVISYVVIIVMYL